MATQHYGWLFLVSCALLVRQCCSDKVFLQDTSRDYYDWTYQQYDGETTASNGNKGWVGYNSTKTFHTCSWEQPVKQNNWLISPHIVIPGGVQELVFDMTYNHLLCDYTQPTFSNCELQLKLMAYYTNAPVNGFVNTSFALLKILQPTTYDTPVTIKEKITPVVGHQGVYIAIVDQGTCVNINEIRVAYYFCNESRYGLWYFPRSFPALHNGTCKVNAHLNPTLTRLCGNDGHWGAVNGDCVCSQGYDKNVAGTECEDLYCKNFPCGNSGICINTGTGYSCNCTAEFVGVNCQDLISVSPCDSCSTTNANEGVAHSVSGYVTVSMLAVFETVMMY